MVAVGPSAKVELFAGPMEIPLFPKRLKSKDPTAWHGHKKILELRRFAGFVTAAMAKERWPSEARSLAVRKAMTIIVCRKSDKKFVITPPKNKHLGQGPFELSLAIFVASSGGGVPPH